MLRKDEFLSTHPDVRTGMDAYTVDGEKLGEVRRLDEDSITIEKGWFFPKDFTVRYDDVVDTREDHVIVRESRGDLDAWRDDRYAGWSEYDQANAAEETRMPLHEEELEAERRQRQGEVRLHKTVHTETRHMEVPVTREEVVVERVPVEEPGRDVGDRAFGEEEARIPIVEEEVEVRKRPVVKEEVRARKERHTEKRDVSGKVRKEDVRVERDRPKE